MSSEDVPSLVLATCRLPPPPPHFRRVSSRLCPRPSQRLGQFCRFSPTLRLADDAQLEILTTTVARLSAAPAPIASPPPSPRPHGLPCLPFVPLRATTFSGVENPETFINDLDRHYRLNSVFYDID